MRCVPRILCKVNWNSLPCRMWLPRPNIALQRMRGRALFRSSSGLGARPRTSELRGLGPDYPMRSAALLLLLVFLAHQRASGQELPVGPLPPGLRVRVTAPSLLSDRLVGRVTQANQDTIYLRRGGGVLPIPFHSIEQLEWSQGRRYWVGLLRGSAIGTLAGGTLVAILAGATFDRERDGNELYNTAGRAAAVGFVIGGFSGFWPGAIIGLWTAPERWRSLSNPRRRRPRAITNLLVAHS
jgi:hypothetical protein